MTDLQRKILLVLMCLVSPFAGLLFGKLLAMVGCSLTDYIDVDVDSDGSGTKVLMFYGSLAAIAGAIIVTIQNWNKTGVTND